MVFGVSERGSALCTKRLRDLLSATLSTQLQVAVLSAARKRVTG